LEILLENGLDPNLENEDMINPLKYSIITEQLDCMKVLLQNDTNLCYDELFYIIDTYFCLKIVEFVVNNSNNIDVNYQDHNGYTILHHIIDKCYEMMRENGSIDENLGLELYKIIRLLLKKGFDPNIENKDGVLILSECMTLYFIDKKYHIKIVKLLLKYNADPNKPIVDAPIVSIIETLWNIDNVDTIKSIMTLLIKYHSKLDVTNYDGETLLEILDGMLPLYSDNDDIKFKKISIIIKLLIKNGCQITKDLEHYYFILSIKQEIEIKVLKKKHERALFAQKYNLYKEIYAPNAIGYIAAKQSFNATSIKNIKYEDKRCDVVNDKKRLHSQCDNISDNTLQESKKMKISNSD
jgi:ankyrin repeat protein